MCNLAETLNYVCPTLDARPGIHITGCYPESADADRRAAYMIITGPSMGDKSNLNMRQTTLIVLLSYIGSFVPAEQAVIGLVDRVFTSVPRTIWLPAPPFMVEMTETTNILHNVTRQNLVLMDKIDRSISDLRCAVAGGGYTENLAGRIKAMTLFATHYLELTTLPEKMEW